VVGRDAMLLLLLLPVEKAEVTPAVVAVARAAAVNREERGAMVG